MITKGEQCSKQIPNDSWGLHYHSVNRIAFEACKEINLEHPELVAQNIKEMYEIIKYLKENCYYYIGGISASRIDSLLSKIKGGE